MSELFDRLSRLFDEGHAIELPDLRSDAPFAPSEVRPAFSGEVHARVDADVDVEAQGFQRVCCRFAEPVAACFEDRRSDANGLNGIA